MEVNDPRADLLLIAVHQTKKTVKSAMVCHNAVLLWQANVHVLP